LFKYNPCLPGAGTPFLKGEFLYVTLKVNLRTFPFNFNPKKSFITAWKNNSYSPLEKGKTGGCIFLAMNNPNKG
jgi:hypothetical protein